MSELDDSMADGGSIADDMIDGTQCHWCGTLFKKPHGHPVLCTDCYDEDPKEAKAHGLTRAYIGELSDEDDV